MILPVVEIPITIAYTRTGISVTVFAIRKKTAPLMPAGDAGVILIGDDTEDSVVNHQLIPEHIKGPDRLTRALEIAVRLSNVSLSGVSYPVPWADVLERNAQKGAAELDRILQTYSAYMNPTVILALRLEEIDMGTRSFGTRYVSSMGY